MSLIKNNNNKNITEHFKTNEFACKDCGKVSIDKNIVISLEKFRQHLNIPINVIRGYDCKAKNRHNISDAIDFNLFCKENAINTLINASKYFKHIGLYLKDDKKVFIHVDNSNNDNLYWLSYEKDNKQYYSYFKHIDSLLAYCIIDTKNDWQNMVI
jgi:hypothetical protein